MDDALTSGSSNLEAMDAAPKYQASMTQLMVSRMGLERGTVLDFGAGSGSYTRAAKSATNWDVQALEPYTALHARIGPGIAVHASLDRVPLASLDGAFSLNVFEHIEDDVGTLRLLARRCQPDAPIFILVPAHMSLWSPMDDLVGHVRRYSLSGLVKMAQAAGMRVESKGWFDTTGFFATHAYRAATRAGLVAKVDGSVTKEQVGAFDRVFSLAEPLFRAAHVPLGKNCWVLLRAQD